MRIRSLILPLTIIVSLMGLLHWFVYLMATQGLNEIPVWLPAFVIVAWLMIPSSLLLSISPLHEKVLPLIMLGYVWLGTFGIAFFFACVQAVIVLLGITVTFPWMLYVVPVIALWSLRINISGPQIIKHKLKGPEFMRSLRVVQISDLHVGNTILREKWLAGVTEKISSLNPDILVVTGDLADGGFEKTAPMLAPLMKIQCQKFYITGNHEYIRGGDWEAHLAKLGFEVLHNTHAIIPWGDGKLLLAGVPDRHVKRFIRDRHSSPDVALKTSEDVGYRILLAHKPSSVFDIKNEKCALLLSGHTHGGQIFPFGLFVRLQQPLAAGFKMINGILVFAHQGTGFWGPPMRWFTRSEIVEFSWE